jgi:hypothetical protein
VSSKLINIMANTNTNVIACGQFSCLLGKVKRAEDVELLMPKLPADFPDWTALWIMDK